MKFVTGLVLSLAPLFAQAPKPIPDLATLLKEVQDHQKAMDAIRDNYTFHRIIRTDDVDSNGAVKKTESLEREIFFVNGHQIGKLVKREGRELKPSEQKDEQQRVTKQVEKFLKTKDKPNRGRNNTISQILPMVKISNGRRETMNGRDTLIYDFVGDPNAKSHDTMQGAMKKMAGTIWFDEKDRQVAKADIHFEDNFRIGGGLLASIQKGTRVTVEQCPVGEGLWLQCSSEQILAGRLVVKKIRQNVHMKDFDFKRFNVETFQQTAHPDSPH